MRRARLPTQPYPWTPNRLPDDPSARTRFRKDRLMSKQAVVPLSCLRRSPVASVSHVHSLRCHSPILSHTTIIANLQLLNVSHCQNHAITPDKATVRVRYIRKGKDHKFVVSRGPVQASSTIRLLVLQSPWLEDQSFGRH
jgi:hypothetical protein